MIMPHRFLLCLLGAVFLLVFQACEEPEKAGLLVFSKTEGFRHASIEAGQEALKKLAADKGMTIEVTEDADVFNQNDLGKYRAIVFLNTTGNVLDSEQQEAFERYIQAGGGYVGIHSATDTEYDWPWYGQLAGARFLDHPMQPSNVQIARMTVVDTTNWATAMMPAEFEWTDEFYNFREMSDDIEAVLTIDETTYEGGKNPDFHPMSWYHEFDGGRAFYTALGHTEEAFADPMFLDHLYAGIEYATGGEDPQPLDYNNARPEENRFAKVVLADNLNEPMELTVLDDDRILFIERRGEVKLYKNSTGELTTIATIPVSTVYTSPTGETSTAEDGLLGLNKDPDFAENQFVYIYYSDPDTSANILSRFTMNGDSLDLDSKKEMLVVAVQRLECCHTGGSIDFDAEGNLYLSTGDNTNPHASSGYSPSDERPGRFPWDAQKSSANTNDLRGKIIRITPQDDGGYTIPEGNLFPEGTDKTRPEIYTMGHRNPFRIYVDKHTGYVYWGDVGPDAREADPSRGPAGHDEVGQARGPGNFGWPHFVGDNKAYHRYDFATETAGEAWNPEAPVNRSPNNTGLETLPPAREAFIWYPYGASPEFPIVGSGARNAMAGPVYYSEDFAGADRAFPDYYDGKFFAYDWMRGWILAVTMDEEGNLQQLERFMPDYKFSNPMDMQFADNGDLYMLEYGSGWFSQNPDARLVRIEYNGGNRLPQATAIADNTGGVLPLTVNLSADEVEDPDNDELTYRWVVTSDKGYEETFNTKDVQLDLDEPASYTAQLTVSDGKGGEAKSNVQISAGNAVPAVRLDLAGANRSFFTPGEPIRYTVQVEDAEDGTLGQGIDEGQVALTMDYLAEGYDQVEVARSHRGADAGAMAMQGESLINENDCISCHAIEKESIGPTYKAVAARYAGESGARDYLVGKIISGGGGVWGENVMSAHPDLDEDQARTMVDYILALDTGDDGEKLPLAGSYTPVLPENDPAQGVYYLRAAYTDKGAPGLGSLMNEDVLILRNSNVGVHTYDETDKIQPFTMGGNRLSIAGGDGAYMMLKNVDLSSVTGLTVAATAPKPRANAVGGLIELHLDSPGGTLVGKSEMLEPSEEMSFAPNMLEIPIEVPAEAGEGLHDLYLVFVNPGHPDDTIMVVTQTRFHVGGGGGQMSR